MGNGNGSGKDSTFSETEKLFELKLVRPPIRPPTSLSLVHQDHSLKRKDRSRSRSESRLSSKQSRLRRWSSSSDSPASTSSYLPPTPPLTRSSSVSSFSSTTTVGTCSGYGNGLTTISSTPPTTRLTFPPARLPAPPASTSTLTESSTQFPFDLNHQMNSQEVEVQSRTGMQLSYPYSQARFNSLSATASLYLTSSSAFPQQIQTPRIRMCSDSTFWRRLALRNATRDVCGVKIVSLSQGEDVYGGEERNVIIGWPRGLIPLQKSMSSDTVADLAVECDGAGEEGEEEVQVFHGRRRYSTASSKMKVGEQQHHIRSSRSASFSVGTKLQNTKSDSHLPSSTSHIYHPSYTSSTSPSSQNNRSALTPTPLTDLTSRKCVARSLKGREGYLVRRKIFEEERILRRVMCEPVVVYSREKDGAQRSSSSSSSSGKGQTLKKARSASFSKSRKVIGSSSTAMGKLGREEKEIEEGKLLSVCWEGRWRTRLMNAW